MLSASGMMFPASNQTATTTKGSGCNMESSETILVLTAASVIEHFIMQQCLELEV